MNIRQTTFPEKSLLYPKREQYDYYDCFGGVTNVDPVDIIELTKAFAKPSPQWLTTLLVLRNAIAGLAGLKTDINKNTDPSRKSDFAIGEHIGFFKVYDRTENEMVLGEDDKHLDFRVSLFLETIENNPTEKRVVVTTVVKYNNWMGPLYFFFVRPLHKLLVPALLKEAFKNY